jgi:formyl-CoA transferase
MLDSVIAMTDIVLNFWSMGLTHGDSGPLINHGFRAADGWFIVQVAREAHFEQLADVIGHREWKSDPRLATRAGWLSHLEDVLRPAIEAWAGARTRFEACAELGAKGVAAGPCLRDDEVAADPHVVARNMVSRIERPDGGRPVLVPGNPVKLSALAEVPDGRVPWLGEHTEQLLTDELGCQSDEIAELKAAGIVG